jgi:hypothetical protein
MRPHRALVGVVAVAVVVGTAALVSGCSSASVGGSAVASGLGPNGIEKKSAQEIVDAAQSAAKSATAVHVKGTAGGTGLDVRIGSDAAHATLSQGGQTVEVLRIGTDHYMKGDTAFWTAQGGAAAATKLADKWVKIGATLAAQYESFLTISTFFSDLSSGDPLTKGGQSDVGGTKAVTVTDTKDQSVLYVSMVDKPLPLKATSPSSDGGSVTFSDWNVPIDDLVAPTQVIDITAQTGG